MKFLTTVQSAPSDVFFNFLNGHVAEYISVTTADLAVDLFSQIRMSASVFSYTQPGLTIFLFFATI